MSEDKNKQFLIIGVVVLVAALILAYYLFSKSKRGAPAIPAGFAVPETTVPVQNVFDNIRTNPFDKKPTANPFAPLSAGESADNPFKNVKLNPFE